MGNLIRQPIFLLFLILAILFATGYSIWTNRKKNTATPAATITQVSETDLTNIDPADFNEFTKEELDLAYAKAREIDPDYTLSALEIEIGSTLKPETVITRYIFTSKSDTSHNWMITISAANRQYIRAKVPKTDYLGDIQPINLQLWKFNYVSALQIAESAGGKYWREGEKDDFQGVILSLKTDSNNSWLVWNAEYKSSESSTSYKIDAYGAKVL